MSTAPDATNRYASDMRSFNTLGPCLPDRHYMLPPAERLPRAQGLIEDGGKRQEQREAIELKVWHPGDSDPERKGLAQLDGYLDLLGLDHGTLVIFDRREPGARIADLVGFHDEKTPSGRPVTLLRV